ncbi:MAG TPA: type II toxin-antitoxin system VapC family toxin [Thermoanaerobaculia bacterium]|nr:type II toxin-antitoxin system VapC family toxin [Thermoanaerobaculia bacterium]
MILVDTSVWIDHLRRKSARLSALLEGGLVLLHPFVVGELALGHLRRRTEILGLLSELPQANAAQHDEVLEFVERHGLTGSGVGWVDAHLLASAALSHASLWTLDRRLVRAAARLALSA